MTCAPTWCPASMAESASGAQPPCSPGVTVHPWSASGGNPKLEPWRAKELDVGYEWYGGKASYFALHGFYMWLDNYIYNQALTGRLLGFHATAGSELSQIPAGRRHQSDRPA